VGFNENEDATRRTRLANERTFLAYVRTSLAFIAFGFVIARFSLFAREFSAIVPVHPVREGMSTGFGTAMAVVGILVVLLGAWRYARTDRGLRRGKIERLSSIAGYTVAALIASIGGVVSLALLAYH
jgi:putative membrane protein